MERVWNEVWNRMATKPNINRTFAIYRNSKGKLKDLKDMTLFAYLAKLCD